MSEDTVLKIASAVVGMVCIGFLLLATTAVHFIIAFVNIALISAINFHMWKGFNK